MQVDEFFNCIDHHEKVVKSTPVTSLNLNNDIKDNNNNK